MKIAQFVHDLGIGGAQQIVKKLVSFNSGSESDYIVYSCLDGFVREGIERAGVEVRLFPRRTSKFDPTLVREIVSALRADDVDLMHAHLFGDSFHGYLATRRAGGLPLVVTLHGEPMLQNRLQRLGYRWLIARCAQTVACSNSMKTAWSNYYNRARTIDVIPNGIDVPKQDPFHADLRGDARSLLGVTSHDVVVASIGRLSSEKGQSFLISAVAQMKRAEIGSVKLVFVGQGPAEVEMRQQITAEGLDSSVCFLGTRSDVPHLLPGVDIVAFPSLSEGLSMTLLESMVSGRCIVGSDVPGILEAVRPDREALIVPRGDVSGLTKALSKASLSPELRCQLGSAARQRALQHFSVGSMVTSYMAVYSRVVDSNKRETDSLWRPTPEK